MNRTNKPRLTIWKTQHKYKIATRCRGRVIIIVGERNEGYTAPTAEAGVKVEPRRSVEPGGSPPPEDVDRTRRSRTVVRGPTARPPATGLGTRTGTEPDSTIVTGIDERTTGRLPVLDDPETGEQLAVTNTGQQAPDKVDRKVTAEPGPDYGSERVDRIGKIAVGGKLRYTGPL